MTPTPAAVADLYRDIAAHLTTTGLGHAAIYPAGIRVDVTDPDTMDRLIASYSLTRDHSLSGHYSGTVDGVAVCVTLTIPAGIIPTRAERVAS
jgi:hypothetical protein